MEDKKMPQAQDLRVAARFTQREDETYKIIRESDHLPVWHKRLIHTTWYTRIPATVWGEQIGVSRHIARSLLRGELVALSDDTIALVNRVCDTYLMLAEHSILPCADTRIIPYLVEFAYNK